MATAEEYEQALKKAEQQKGVDKLTKQEQELMQRMYKEVGSRGNRARKVIDGK